MDETIKVLEQARAAITAAHVVGGQAACDDAVAAIDIELGKAAKREQQKDADWVQVLQAVQAQFRRFGNSMPDGFDSRVFRWVDDLMAGQAVAVQGLDETEQVDGCITADAAVTALRAALADMRAIHCDVPESGSLVGYFCNRMKEQAAGKRKSEQLTLESAPLGTKAPAIGGGHWVKVERGWKWATGATFPRPGGDWTGVLVPPGQEDDGRTAGAAINGRMYRALVALLRRDEQNTCQHQDTHRGGAIWTICDDCGAQWADDQGGKPKWQDPKEWVEARDVIDEAVRTGGQALSADDADLALLRLLADLPCDALGRAQEAARMRLERLSEVAG